MKKYFVYTIIVLVMLVFVLPTTTLAARLAPGAGQVPDQQPLQPIPDSIAPNYSGSVDRKAEDYVAEPNTDSTKTLPVQDPRVDSGNPECIGPDCTSGTSKNEQNHNYYLYFATTAILILVFIGIATVVYKKKN